MTSNSVCIFCDRPWGGDVKHSEQHVLGQALHKHAGELPNARNSQTMGLEFDPNSQEFVVQPMTLPVIRNSSLLNLRTRDVCENCNTVWMRMFEEQVTPLILALAEAAKSNTRMMLSRAEALTVARWAEITTLTHELTSRGPKVGDGSMGTRLRSGKLIRGSTVWLARNQDDLDIQARQAHVEISDTPFVPPDDGYRQSLLFGMTWHYLTFLSYVPDSPRLGPCLPFDRWTLVVPSGSSGIDYPPMRSLPTAELNSTFSNLNWLPAVHHSGVRTA